MITRTLRVEVDNKWLGGRTADVLAVTPYSEVISVVMLGVFVLATTAGSMMVFEMNSFLGGAATAATGMMWTSKC